MSLPVKPMRRHHSRERTPKRRTMLLFSPSQRWVCMWTPALRARRMVSVKVSSVQLMGWQGASTICRMEKGLASWYFSMSVRVWAIKVSVSSRISSGMGLPSDMGRVFVARPA